MVAEPRFFSLDYVERAVLTDGTHAELRLVRADDKELLRAGFDHWSPESRYSRFLGSKTSLSDDELRYLCELDHEHHFAIGAVRAARDDEPMHDGRNGAPLDPTIGLGIARFIRLPERPNTAEAAIAVADHAQHKGLGKLLLLRLIAAATERGVERLRLELLGSNTGMTALLAAISPDRTTEIGGGIMSVELELPRVAPTQPPAAEQPELQGPLFRLFRAAATNAVDWTNTVRRFWRRSEDE